MARTVTVLTSALALTATGWLAVAPGAGAAGLAGTPSAPAKAAASSPAPAPPAPATHPGSATHPAGSAPAPAVPPAAPPAPAPSPASTPQAPDTPFQLPPPPAPAPAPASAAPPAAPVTVAPPSGKADDGAYVAGEKWLDPRMADLSIGSLSVGATVPVRIIVPAGWTAADGGETWPVLYLLQGAHDDYTAWTRETDIESFVADKGLIVVMPSAGPTGIPTRWYNGGKNKPDYETFEAVELMQLMERDFHAGTTRAVAGVSTGGYGAMMMAAHYPGTFAAAASYSGVVNTTYPGMPSVMRAIVARESIQPDALWGDPVRNAQLWTENNPYANATNLRLTSLFVSCGDGSGPAQNAALGQTLERAVRPQNVAFASRLGVLGIPVQTDFYTGGVHDWVSWKTAFAASWPMLAASLGLPS
jgi:diacylglycerol O-acyltransferase / trehalose O-mycolyltransferase